MNRTSLLTTVALLMMIIVSSAFLDDNGRAGAVGSPGETTCNTNDCHDSFAPNSGGGSVRASSTMVNWQYEPLTTYSISITVAKPSVGLFGFGTEILTATNANAGTINVSDAVHTQIKSRNVNGVNRRNIVHKLNGGVSQDSMVFTFSWFSPDTTTGPITMYFAGNATNGNGNENGDYIYTGNQVITPASGIGIHKLTTADPFTVYPNPASSSINIQYTLSKDENVSVRLIGTDGSCKTLSSELKPAGKNIDRLSIPDDLPGGMYILTLESNSGRISQKLLVD